MSVVGRRRDEVPSGASGAWTAVRRAAAGLVITVAVTALIAVMLGRSEAAASEPSGTGAVLHGTDPIEVRAALLSNEVAREQMMPCRYEVKATFGVSVFTDARTSAKRLKRIYNGSELFGSCFAADGEETIGCAGLSWEHEWIRVRSGTMIGWSPASCFEQLGQL